MQNTPGLRSEKTLSACLPLRAGRAAVRAARLQGARRPLRREAALAQLGAQRGSVAGFSPPRVVAAAARKVQHLASLLDRVEGTWDGARGHALSGSH